MYSMLNSKFKKEKEKEKEKVPHSQIATMPNTR